MERYTIRILYRNRETPEKFVGVVEGTGDTVTRGFVSMEGLWRILNSHGPGSSGEEAVSSGEKEHRSREELIELFWSLRER
jgi:hypothetical protein